MLQNNHIHFSLCHWKNHGKNAPPHHLFFDDISNRPCKLRWLALLANSCQAVPHACGGLLVEEDFPATSTSTFVGRIVSRLISIMYNVFSFLE